MTALASLTFVACDDGGESETPTDATVVIIDGSTAPDAGPEPDMMLEPDAAPAPEGVGVLGYESHSIDGVILTEVATGADGLNTPRDLAFNPERANELWVVSQTTDAATIITATGTSRQGSVTIIDPFALHFLDAPSSIAFGQPDTFGSCQESRNTYNNQAQANDFMGPSLWSSDPAIFGRSNPDAVEGVGADLGSHLDMLHETPWCMGMAWANDNVYWVFEGLTGSIMRADFAADHGVGWDDHSDGRMWRFGVGEVERVANVPSHLVYEPSNQMLYIADSGNGRIGVLDTTVGEIERPLPVTEPGTQLMLVEDSAPIEDFGSSADDLERPSGLERGPDGLLYVSDNATSRIWAYNDAGEVVDWLDTGLPEGALMGMAFNTDGALFIVDAVGDRVLRLEAKTE
jgi:hypothetical protein